MLRLQVGFGRRPRVAAPGRTATFVIDATRPRAGTRLIGAGDLVAYCVAVGAHDLALAAERTYIGFRATAGTSKATATVIVLALHPLVVAPVEGSVVLMFVTVGFVAVAIGAFSNFVGYRIRRQDCRREAR
jgi:hypothetical protein